MAYPRCFVGTQAERHVLEGVILTILYVLASLKQTLFELFGLAGGSCNFVEVIACEMFRLDVRSAQNLCEVALIILLIVVLGPGSPPEFLF